MQIHSVGIDLGKTTFHLVALGEAGKVLVQKKFSQRQLLTYTANMQTCLIGLEGSVALTRWSAVVAYRANDQAATWKSWFTKRISLRTPGLHVRQCPRRNIRMISKPLIVDTAVFMV